MEPIFGVRKFISRWYKRYLVSTELYMVEPWEKVFTHILLIIIFSLFWYFNRTIIVNGLSLWRGEESQVDELRFATN